MATVTEQAQTTVPTCPDHKNQHLLSYCRTCHKRICEHCVKGPHSEHDWTFLQNHVRQVRNEGHKIAKEIREEIIAFLKKKRDDTTREQEKAKIRSMQQNLKDLIDEYSDEMVTLIDGDYNISDVDREIEEFEKWAIFFEKNVRTEYDSVVVEMDEEYHAKLCQHKASNAASQDKVRHFQEGTIDKDKIKTMMGRVAKVKESGRVEKDKDSWREEKFKEGGRVGKVKEGGRVEKVKESQPISTLNVTVRTTIRHAEHFIKSIQAMSENKALISFSGKKKTTLIDSSGKKLETYNYGTKFTDFLIKDNDQIFTHCYENYIAVLSSGKVRKICSTSLHPYGICQSQEGGMLVCLSDSLLGEIVASSKGEIHHMDMAGTVKKRYHLNETDNTKLLTFPYRVVQNINSDLCVCDKLDSREISRLVAITKESRIRFTYHGQPSLKEIFNLFDVACDSVGRIILNDFDNHAVHMLSIDGQFIQFLLTSGDGLSYPKDLALYGGTMWVGNNKGVIKICELKQQRS